jgi:thiol-disulfide isomerase/thioredoxin
MPHAPSRLFRLSRGSVALTCGTILLVGLTGCGKGQPKGPVTAETSAYQVDDGSSRAGKPAVGDNTPGGAQVNLNDQGTGLEAAKANLSDQTPSAGPGRPQAKPGPGDGDVPAPPRTPPLSPDAQGDPYAIPEKPEALVTFLQELRNRPPQGANQNQLIEDFRRIQGAKIAAADKLSKLSKEKKDRLAAAMAKSDALRELTRLGPEHDKELHNYCSQLLKDKDPDVARLGRLIRFGLAVDDLAAKKVTDVKAVFEELKAIVASSDKDPGVFVVTSQAAMLLQQMGHKDLAREAYQLLAATYQDSNDPEIAARAQELLTQVRVLDVDLYAKVNAMMKGQPNGAAAVLAAMKTLLSEPNPGAALFSTLGQVAQFVEMSRQYAAAGQAYAMIEEAFKTSPDKKLADEAAASAERGRRRVGLVGKPFTVAGALIDGSPFDWTKYKGKVVLIDFWATWCRPCLEEIPTIEQAYQRYREKGFEVVGVNLDEDPRQVDHFFQAQPLPWPTVLSADPAARGFQHPLAVHCGIESIPFIVLVDRDGTVKQLHVRGPEIDRQLAALLGPAEPAEPAEKLPSAKPGLLPLEPEPKP